MHVYGFVWLYTFMHVKVCLGGIVYVCVWVCMFACMCFRCVDLCIRVYCRV